MALAGCGADDAQPGNGGNPPPPGTNGPPPSTLAECGAFTPGNDLNVCTATYLGGGGADRMSGVAIAADGTIIVAGAVPDQDFGEAATPLLGGGGDGVVLRLSPTGGEVLGVTRLPAPVLDMELNAKDGTVAVAGDFGVAVLAADAGDVVWSATLEAAVRVAAGSDGTVAALARETITVFDSAGDMAGAFTLDDGNVEDIAVYGPDALVIATGYNQVSDVLQQPFLRAYDYSGGEVWSSYGWSAAEAGDLSSDTRGYAVAIGRDNYLYYGGESHGGVTTHFKDPRDLGQDAPIVRFDAYNESYDWNGAAPLSFYARFDPGDGTMLLGQLIAPRLSSGKGNGARIRHITANEDGTVLVGGGSACCIEGGSDKTIDGVPAMPDYAGGGFVLVASADFTTRHVWTTWSGSSSGAIGGVAAWGGAMAAVQTQEADEDTGALAGSLVVIDALQREPAGGASEGHLSVWPSP